MKFEKITDTKIKIILSLSDMESNNISIDNIISNSESSQKLLQNILCMAEKKIGFNPGDSKLLVEVIQSMSNECIYTITKLPNKKIICRNCSNSLIFKFENFDDFINLCAFLKGSNYLNLKDFSKNFSLIYYNGTYYLRALESNSFSVLLDYLKLLFSEFGKDVSSSHCIEGLLSEYGKVIFRRNAINKCINLFVPNLSFKL